MLILAIETSTGACSVAIWNDGEVTEELVLADPRHSASLLAMIDGMLTRSTYRLKDFDALAFGCGPGSFTGVRLGVGVAQGLAFGAGLPTVPVSSLDALAARASAAHVIAAIDARMDEVYWRCYGGGEPGGIPRPIGSIGLTSPDTVVVTAGRNWVGIGSGWDRYSERLERATGCTRWIARVTPHASDVARLAAKRVVAGKTVSAICALPDYVRQQVANKPASKAP